jgi:hypothetical protein
MEISTREKYIITHQQTYSKLQPKMNLTLLPHNRAIVIPIVLMNVLRKITTYY